MANAAKPISLAPLDFDQAVSGIMQVKPMTRKPCECGCGKTPKGEKSRFLPGHDLRKLVQDAKG